MHNHRKDSAKRLFPASRRGLSGLETLFHEGQGARENRPPRGGEKGMLILDNWPEMAFKAVRRRPNLMGPPRW